MFASGGNDNKLFTWQFGENELPSHSYLSHQAAVKAISWSSFNKDLLVSGGGTADRTLKFWNTSISNILHENVFSNIDNGEYPICSVDTGS